MDVVSAAEARNHLAEVIERAAHGPVAIERRGERAAVIVSPQEYDRLMEALEDIEDAAAYDAAIAEEGTNIPWDQVKADLGLA
ncbi:type II toxin-antitoxin system Phd/YefM family antitoxin [Leifsonia sp. 2MCAF36]|uniref:type II toxin-antitoxin system Phd/YefM family antitoxin n=1 Tax=Leifsonia sp. 2MCAF36 TaxID=3232988 RepID=UPI003F9B0E55